MREFAKVETVGHPLGEGNLAHQSMLMEWGRQNRAFARGLRYIRIKRTAADLAATHELIRGMPRGREL
jgi:hypothetical protein